MESTRECSETTGPRERRSKLRRCLVLVYASRSTVSRTYRRPLVIPSAARDLLFPPGEKQIPRCARDDRGLRHQGNNGGVDRFLVACSNAYANSISFGSLHAVPVKLTLNGAGRGSKPSGKAVGPVPTGTGTNPYGTVTVGYPGRAPIPALDTPGKSSASRRLAFNAASIPFVADNRMSFLRSASYRARSA